MKACETPAPTPQESETKKRQHWPIEVRNGSVTAKIYRSGKKLKDGSPRHFSIAYYLPSGRKVDQRGSLEDAKEHARLMVDSIAAGEVDAAEMSKHDRLELLALRERAAQHGLQPLMAMDEWLKARSFAGPEVITACERWKNRLTQFTRISVHDAILGCYQSFITKNRARRSPTATRQQLDELVPKSYRIVLSDFGEVFGDRYVDDLRKAELQEWVNSKGTTSGWTANTYRKRMVMLFNWARENTHLPRDQVTEADMTTRATEDAPQRELTTPKTLGRILWLLQTGRDILEEGKQYEPRPELVPALAISAFCGYRSSEGHQQTWEDLDIEERQGSVTHAKRGTMGDRATRLPDCAIAWLQLTPENERSGVIHAYDTEVHTLIRNHLMRTIGLRLPPNTLRKSWESYRYVLSHDDGHNTADEAGHTPSIQAKHYRNPRAKRSVAKAWFEVTPFNVEENEPMTTEEGSLNLYRPDPAFLATNPRPD